LSRFTAVCVEASSKERFGNRQRQPVNVDIDHYSLNAGLPVHRVRLQELVLNRFLHV